MKSKKVLSLCLLTSLLLLGACGQKDSSADKEATAAKSSQSSSVKKSSKKAASSQKEVEQSSSEAVSTSSESQAASDSSSEANVLTRLEGTWTAVNVQGYPTTMTIDGNGNMSWTMKNTDNQTEISGQVQATPVQVGDNLYRWDYISGQESALLPGVTGLGGAGFQTQSGFRLVNGQYTPVQFTAPMNQAFDYSKATDIPFSFQKQ